MVEKDMDRFSSLTFGWTRVLSFREKTGTCPHCWLFLTLFEWQTVVYEALTVFQSQQHVSENHWSGYLTVWADNLARFCPGILVTHRNSDTPLLWPVCRRAGESKRATNFRCSCQWRAEIPRLSLEKKILCFRLPSVPRNEICVSKICIDLKTCVSFVVYFRQQLR